MQKSLDKLQPSVFTFVFPHIRGCQCSFLSPVYEDLATPFWEEATTSMEAAAARQRVPHKKPERVSSGFAPNRILLVVFEVFPPELLQIETTLISVTLVFFFFFNPTDCQSVEHRTADLLLRSGQRPH